MNAFEAIVNKYREVELPQSSWDTTRLNHFSLNFFADVAQTYDLVTRLRNIERNETGFDLNDAPILGLLVKISKILRGIISYCQAGDANMISYLDRQIIEAGVVARYLLQARPETIENYRKCSYKDRLRIFEAAEGEGIFATPAGKRMKQNVRAQFESEGFDSGSFESQKKQGWRLDGKTVRDMFEALGMDDLYNHVYGFGSESIHASWGHSMTLDLRLNDDRTYSPHPVETPSDVRYVAAIVEIINPAFVEWAKRIRVDEHTGSLTWVAEVNGLLFGAFTKA